MIFVALAMLAFQASGTDQMKLIEEVRVLEQRLADQTKLRDRVAAQGRDGLVRDKNKVIKQITTELNDKKAILNGMANKANNDANQAKNDNRAAEEKALLAKNAKSSNGIVLGTSLANYFEPTEVLHQTSGGIVFYAFDYHKSGIPLPKACQNYGMTFLLAADKATNKVIGTAFVATKHDDTIVDTAINAARQKSEKVSIDSIGRFSGITKDGIEINVYGSIREVFQGMTFVTYFDPDLKKKATLKGGQESGF